METVAVVLSVKPDQVEAFEAGFREHELPIWRDFHGRGVMLQATLSRPPAPFRSGTVLLVGVRVDARQIDPIHRRDRSP